MLILEEMNLADPALKHPIPSEIIPGIYLGNGDQACDRAVLDKFNIRSVVNCTNSVENKFETDPAFSYFRCRLHDDCFMDLTKYINEACDFVIDQYNKEDSGAILIHCKYGVSRSATVTMASLIRLKGMSLRDAYILTKEKRPVIAPNPNFWKQLFKFEEKITEKPASLDLVPCFSCAKTYLDRKYMTELECKHCCCDSCYETLEDKKCCAQCLRTWRLQQGKRDSMMELPIGQRRDSITECQNLIFSPSTEEQNESEMWF
eukprot:TRINITY_DN11992_c0_g2_i1.p1 TRINITY_DN11992_c0_g2~~TRINITY_DN11992_c0_g2_i1.p1  ORF type:complete len:261 (-),score=56.07 TRINITY_DN11992_c0_g2_i1:277-1059(-)